MLSDQQNIQAGLCKFVSLYIVCRPLNRGNHRLMDLSHATDITTVSYKSLFTNIMGFILHHLLQCEVNWHGGVTSGACVPSLGQRCVRSAMWEQERHRCPMG